MITRVITAIIALVVFIPIMIIGGIAMQIFISIMAVLGVFELFRMRGLEVRSLEGAFAILGAFFLVFPLHEYFGVLPTDGNWLLFFVTVLGCLAMVVISKNTYTFEDAGFPVLVSLYVGVGFQYLVKARLHNVYALFLALLIVWATDIGAYMVGRKYGKHKLAPDISPNKTIEGSVGGVVSAVIVVMIFLFFFPARETFDLSFVYIAIMSVVFSIAAQFGDLVESAFKRYYNVKDSGKLLPGHGGILDRFDSLLFVFPLMHLFGIF